MKHGLAPRRAAARSASAGRAGGLTLRIGVEDTGVGFDPAIAQPGTGRRSPKRRERLRAHYGTASRRSRSGARRHGGTVDRDRRCPPIACVGTRRRRPDDRPVDRCDDAVSSPTTSGRRGRFWRRCSARIPDVSVVGEAANGAEAIQLIEQHRPDVALLDLQMPEVDGLSVVRLLRRRFLPLVIFVTAYDEYAVKAFELNAVDYLTKPVSEARLREALRRVRERLERQRPARTRADDQLREAVGSYDRIAPAARLERIPVRRKDDIVLVPVSQIASIVADGELLHLTTMRQERHTISYRLKDLEARLDPGEVHPPGPRRARQYRRIVRVTPMPGGMYTVKLQNGQELDVSRIQSRLLEAAAAVVAADPIAQTEIQPAPGPPAA